jgi:hypothetical protein
LCVDHAVTGVQTCALPIFFGKYKVTVNGVSKVADLTREKGNVIVDFTK